MKAIHCIPNLLHSGKSGSNDFLKSLYVPSPSLNEFGTILLTKFSLDLRLTLNYSGRLAAAVLTLL